MKKEKHLKVKKKKKKRVIADEEVVLCPNPKSLNCGMKKWINSSMPCHKGKRKN